MKLSNVSKTFDGMKKQYFLGLMVVVLLTLFNVSPVFAHDGVEHTSTAQAIVHQVTPRVGFLQFFKNLFSKSKDSLPANAITSAKVSPAKISISEQKVNEQEIRQLTAKLNSIDASIRTQTTVLENSVLNKLVPSKIVSKNTIGKAIEDKNKLLVTLAEKSPNDAIKFIEKNKLVGKKQVVGTPVTILKKKNVVIDIGHFDYDNSDIADYFATYIDGRVAKTVFAEEFRGLGGEYNIAEFTGYQFGNNILVTQMSGFEQIIQTGEIQQRSTSDADYNVLVLLVDYLDSDQPQQLIDAPTAHDILFNGDLHDFFYEQSYGKMNMVGDVYGWYTLQSNAEGTYCNPMLTANNNNFGPFDNQELMSYLVADSIQVASYDHVIIISNCKNVTGGGFGTKLDYGNLNASLSGWQDIGFTYFGQSTPLAVVKTSNGSANLHTLAHEMGHILYGGPSSIQTYGHANSMDCGDQIINGQTGCFNIEYGNYFDAMGSWQAFSNHFRVGFKEALGWFEPDQILTITESSGDEDFYNLTPLERIGGFNTELGDHKMAKLQPPYMNYVPYIIEYRQSIGYDSNLTGELGNNTDGLFIYKNSSNSPAEIQNAVLLDMNPQSIPWNDDVRHVTLNVGQTFTDEQLGINIEMINANPQHAFFRVVYTEDTTCQRSPPTFNFQSPSNFLYSIAPHNGEVARYIIIHKVVNNDSIFCDSSIFSTDTSVDQPLIVSNSDGSWSDFSLNSAGGISDNWRASFIGVPIGTPVGVYMFNIMTTNIVSGQSTTQTVPITVN